MKILLILLSLSTVSLADNYTFIGKDRSGEVKHKRLSINERDTTKSLEALKKDYPELSWSVAKEGETDYDMPMPKTLSAKERYKTASTTEEKLALIEEILNLK